MGGLAITSILQKLRGSDTDVQNVARNLGSWRRATICCVRSGKIHSLRILREANGKLTCLPENSKDRDRFLHDADATVFAILPKRLYLTRNLTVPHAEPDAVRGMLSLEAVAPLQPEFGPAEVSYSKLKELDAGQELYEVYIVRENDIAQYWHILQQGGFCPSVIIPSAAMWKVFFAHPGQELHLCFAEPIGTDAGEAAVRCHDDTTIVRSAPSGGNDDRTSASHFLQECLRTARTYASESQDPIRMGLIGREQASDLLQQEDSVKQVQTIPFESLCSEIDQDGAEPLTLMAAGALASNKGYDWQTADLTPRHVIFLRRQQRLWKQLVFSLGLLFCSLGLLLVAGKIAVARYGRVCADMDAKISEIKAIGESVEHQLTQLDAVRLTNASQGHLFDVVAALNEVTPHGISYCQVDLTDDLELRIRGQASSASLPFLLPERLEEHGLFQQVTLRGVGQRSQGAGSITQFDLICRLREGRQ